MSNNYLILYKPNEVIEAFLKMGDSLSWHKIDNLRLTIIQMTENDFKYFNDSGYLIFCDAKKWNITIFLKRHLQTLGFLY